MIKGEMKIPFYYQQTCWTCGAASLRMALEALSIKKSEKEIVRLLKTNKRRGSYHRYFPIVAEKFKLNYIVMRNSSVDDVRELISKRWIVIVNHFDNKMKVDHYVVVTKIDKNYLYLNDPWYEEDRNDKISIKEFKSIWHDTELEKGWLFAVRGGR